MDLKKRTIHTKSEAFWLKVEKNTDFIKSNSSQTKQ